MPAHHDFAIPELVLLVSEHLHPRDLAQCVRVCRAWWREFEPVLWKNFCLKRHRGYSLSGTRPSPLKIALTRNLPHIRTLKSSDTTAALLRVLTTGCSTSPSTLCTNLKRLDFEFKYVRSKDVDLPSQDLARLLDLNPRLTHLRLPIQILGADAALAAVSKLDCLQHICVYSLEYCTSFRAVSLFLQACLPLPNLAELLIDMSVLDDYSESDLRSIVQGASMARFSRTPAATKIKTMHFPKKNYEVEHNLLPRIFLESNLLDLESCEIPWFFKKTDLEEIEQTVRKHCPHLKFLSYSSFIDEGEDAEYACTFILACSGIRRFVSHEFSDQDTPTGRRILSTLVSHHAKTLEVLELTNCLQADSNDQQEVLSQCKQLKRFWVLPRSPDNSLNIGISTIDVCRRPWVCTGLTELGLTLNRIPAIDDHFARMRSADGQALDAEYAADVWTAAASKYLYYQIGRLVKLEVLALGIDNGDFTNANKGDYAWDLTLTRGWLGQLAGLKTLKVLRLQGDLWSGMGQAEVEFIHEHWPLLREITLQGYVLQLDLQSPWLWLLNKRPYLRLVVNS